jgi:hypothetical protein
MPHRTLLLLLLLNLTGTSLLLNALPATAQAPRIRYKPKTKRPVLTQSEAGGTRNGALEGLAYVTPLVSQEVTPQTSKAHPSFAWYIHNPQGKAISLDFALIEPGVQRPIYRTRINTSQKGFMQLQMPDTAPALQQDKQYRWTMIVVNDPNRSSLSQRLNGGVVRVNMGAIADDSAGTYAESGLWYDALEAAAKMRHTPDSQEIWLPLLEQGGLNEIADLERGAGPYIDPQDLINHRARQPAVGE